MSTDALRSSSIFSGASEALLASLGSVATVVQLTKGEVLFHQGDVAKALYVLKSGHLDISTISSEGKKLTLNVLGPGEVFGEVALLDGGTRTAGVTALEPCALLRISRKDLLEELSARPEIALDLLRVAMNRVRWVSNQLENHAFLPLKARLATRLLFLWRAYQKQDGGLAMSQSDLAEHVGATREAVAKILADWKRDRIVDMGRGRLTLLDLAALEETSQNLT